MYLTRHGGWNELRERVLEPAARRGRPTSGLPRRAGPLHRRALRFDRGEVDHILTSIDSATLRPRYQSDLIDEEDRRRFDAELAPLAPAPAELVYDACTGEVHSVSPAAAELLDRCDGRRTVEEVVENIPEPHREDARRCLRELASAGLLAATAATR